jgi:tetratricopeptide (TPR) repeat protein
LSAYERACRLDPKLYDAPLFMGDVYFRMNQLTWASQWFEQAVKVDPDRETAYRYWGDALMAAGKMEEARAKFVDAIIAEPYQRLSWVGLKRWAQRQQVKLARLELQSPHSIKVGDGKPDITINVDPNALTRKDGTEFWVVYTVQRARWRKQEFSKAFPDEKTYRHSLREETDALGLLASTVAKEYSNPDKAKKLDPSLATLLKVKSEDLLEAYVLLSAVDEGIAKDYPAYRAIHRDKLRQYLNEYIIQPPQP